MSPMATPRALPGGSELDHGSAASPGRPLQLEGCAGVRLSARAYGAEPASVLLLHGLGDHAGVWAPVLGALDPRVGAVALDLRGHGESGRSPDGEYPRAAHVGDLERVLTQLGASQRRLVLVGHSLGGSLAIEYAATTRDPIAGLCLLDVAPALEREAVDRLDQGLREHVERFASVREYVEHLEQRYWIAQPAALEAFARAGLRANADGTYVPKLDPAVRRVLRDRDAGRDVWEDLRRIEVPVQVVRANGSAVLSRAAARRMVDEVLPNGRLVEVTRAGHSLLLDNPEAVARAVAPFVESLVLGDVTPC